MRTRIKNNIATLNTTYYKEDELIFTLLDISKCVYVEEPGIININTETFKDELWKIRDMPTSRLKDTFDGASISREYLKYLIDELIEIHNKNIVIKEIVIVPDIRYRTPRHTDTELNKSLALVYALKHVGEDTISSLNLKKVANLLHIGANLKPALALKTFGAILSIKDSYDHIYHLKLKTGKVGKLGYELIYALDSDKSLEDFLSEQNRLKKMFGLSKELCFINEKDGDIVVRVFNNTKEAELGNYSFID